MKSKRLHPVQKKLIDLLAKNIDDPLTIRAMQDRLGLSSPSVVAHHLSQLEKRGYLKKNPHNPRDYQILKNAPEKQITFLNLYGLAHCGPNGSILDGNPIDRIPISSRLLTFAASEAFMVKANGDSMKPKINDGDLVIAQKTKRIENGKIVVCTNDGEALIKKIRREKRTVILISTNHDFPPFIASDNFKIEGEVKGIISNNLY
ncbi:MAG: repressor LexA [Candidatus Saganbacteria bacterium]|nr:repressor LexA [Candidatus Saganbacteria bacterium]